VVKATTVEYFTRGSTAEPNRRFKTETQTSRTLVQ